MQLLNFNAMHQADLNTTTFDGQSAYTTVPAFNTAAPNTTVTNNNAFLGFLTPSQLMAFDLNHALPSVPSTLQATPMSLTSTSSSMLTYEMIPPALSSSNHLSLPADANNVLIGLSETQLQFCEHLFQLSDSSHNNINNLTTYDGTTAFPDLNLHASGAAGGGSCPNVLQVTQGFVMTNTLLPISSILSVDQQQQQQQRLQHQQDMSCLLESPAFEIYGTTIGSSGQSSELHVAPYLSNVLGPNIMHQLQQQQPILTSQQQQPIMASFQQQPILASQQPILATQQTPILASQQYYPTTSVNNNNYNITNNIPVQPVVSPSSPTTSSPATAHNTFQQQQQQQHRYELKQEMHQYYQHVRKQEQMRQQQQFQEQQQLQQLPEKQLLQEQQQLVYNQGYATTSAPTAVYSSSSANQVPAPFCQPAFDTWNINPHAAITIPVSPTGPASPVDDLSSCNSSAGLGTPLENMVPRFNSHQLRIQQQKKQLIDLTGNVNESTMTVDQQLLAAATDLKNLQYLDELQIQNQTLRQQSHQQQGGDGWMNQTQVQSQPKTQGQGAANREELLNYRGYRYHGYRETSGGTSQALQSNQTQTTTSQAVQNDQGLFDYLSLSSAFSQKQPAFSQDQVAIIHGSPSAGATQSLPAQVAQMQSLPVCEAFEASSVASTSPVKNNFQLAPLNFAPYPTTNINHYQMATARSNNNGSGSSNNNQQQQYATPPSSTLRQDQAESSSNNNNSNSKSCQQPNMLSLPSTPSSSHLQKQDGSTNNNQQQSTHSAFLQEKEQQQDLYYGFSFGPQEGFEKQESWPSLVTGAPLSEAAVPSLIRGLHGTVKDGDDFGLHNVHYATAQLQLNADMTLSDAFSTDQNNNSPIRTRNILTGDTGSPIEYQSIQNGDEVVVVVKREKKSSLDCIDAKADEQSRKNRILSLGKGCRGGNRGSNNEFDSCSAQAANQMAQPFLVAAPIATPTTFTNAAINNNVNKNINYNNDDDADYILPPPLTKPVRRGSRVSKKGVVQKPSSSSSPPAEPQIWTCPIPHCNRQFASYGLLKSHKVSHDSQKPYWCDICSEDGVTPRPVSPTPIYPGIPVATPEVKKYKRHHDLLRHKREQHPPLEVKIQRFKEKMETKEARRLKAEETRREKAATKRLANAAANAAAGRPATGRRHPSSATTTTTTPADAPRSRRTSSSAARVTAPRGRRASSTTNATALVSTPVAAPFGAPVAAPALPEPAKITRKRKSSEIKRSTTNGEGDEEDGKDSDYQETGIKRRSRSKTSSTARINIFPTLTAATTRRRRSSADQAQQQQHHQATNNVNISSSAFGLVSIPLPASTGEQYIYDPHLLQVQVQQAQQAHAQAQASQGRRRRSSTEQLKHKL
ncbi:hypothetical protein BGZ96_003709 [Linnemannia gamsii]|uniref:C2H2-type domain-containing protein n=1 Tax=Linnemannia gamsii TaxID=64522 RepID=A0ABQ7K8E6_9FUNG|nr:hypothetical protein BGZ96_003709 [Linnemannia gamsii]